MISPDPDHLSEEIYSSGRIRTWRKTAVCGNTSENIRNKFHVRIIFIWRYIADQTGFWTQIADKTNMYSMNCRKNDLFRYPFDSSWLTCLLRSAKQLCNIHSKPLFVKTFTEKVKFPGRPQKKWPASSDKTCLSEPKSLRENKKSWKLHLKKSGNGVY